MTFFGFITRVVDYSTPTSISRKMKTKTTNTLMKRSGFIGTVSYLKKQAKTYGEPINEVFEEFITGTKAWGIPKEVLSVLSFWDKVKHFAESMQVCRVAGVPATNIWSGVFASARNGLHHDLKVFVMGEMLVKLDFFAKNLRLVQYRCCNLNCSILIWPGDVYFTNVDESKVSCVRQACKSALQVDQRSIASPSKLINL